MFDFNLISDKRTSLGPPWPGLLEPLPEPSPGDLPIPLYRLSRYAEYIGRFVESHSAKVFQFNDLCLTFIERGKMVKSFVKSR